MRVPNTEQDVVFQYKEAKWNPPLLPGAFEQKPPGGVRTQFVTCDKDAGTAPEAGSGGALGPPSHDPKRGPRSGV